MAVNRERHWCVRNITSSLTNIPARAGLYAIGHDETVEGLETTRIYVYIGMTKNLRRRLTEHSVENEPKPELKKYLKRNLEKAKCWYTTDVDSGILQKLERKLIRKFNPPCNDCHSNRKTRQII